VADHEGRCTIRRLFLNDDHEQDYLGGLPYLPHGKKRFQLRIYYFWRGRFGILACSVAKVSGVRLWPFGPRLFLALPSHTVSYPSIWEQFDIMAGHMLLRQVLQL
jgi:hypothetical protein